VLEEQAFDPARHDRHTFRCGEPVLDEYLQRYAAQQSAKGICTVFVLVDDARPAQILGYYTLSAAQLSAEQLTPAERKKLPRYPVPCFRLGRLARDLSARGTGIGELLIGCAVARCRKAQAIVGSYAMMVDAKNDVAKSFYEHYGFTACADLPFTLYLSLR
jgi:GNAT superfamily N-acetyltransferase